MQLYNELSTVKDEVGLAKYEQQLIDRFGPIPETGKALLNSLRIKWIAVDIGIEKLIMKQGSMTAYFVGDQQSDYYQSNKFRHILLFVQQHSQLCKMKEKETKQGLRLLLTFPNIKTVQIALEMMQLLKGIS